MSLGTDLESVSAALSEQGYDVLEIEIEDGLIEAKVSDADGIWEVEVDPSTGAVLSVEAEDNDAGEGAYDTDDDHDDA
jgi:hypothetical protein